MSFHHLSVETACDIFIQADRTTYFCIPHPHSIPLVVTSVCRCWRNAALACQPLWKFYEIRGSNLVYNGSTFVARAGDRPVYVLASEGASLLNKSVCSLFTNRTV